MMDSSKAFPSRHNHLNAESIYKFQSDHFKTPFKCLYNDTDLSFSCTNATGKLGRITKVYFESVTRAIAALTQINR